MGATNKTIMNEAEQSGIIKPFDYGFKQKQPVIFLAGPFHPEMNWQNTAARLINPATQGLYVASPRPERFESKELRQAWDWRRQIIWESHYSQLAGLGPEGGAMMIWLAREPKSSYFQNIMRALKGEKKKDWAKNSRAETGEWLARSAIQGARVVLGIEPGFSGAEYLRQRAQKEFHVSVYASLEETCEAAVERAHRN